MQAIYAMYPQAGAYISDLCDVSVSRGLYKQFIRYIRKQELI